MEEGEPGQKSLSLMDCSVSAGNIFLQNAHGASADSIGDVFEEIEYRGGFTAGGVEERGRERRRFFSSSNALRSSSRRRFSSSTLEQQISNRSR